MLTEIPAQGPQRADDQEECEDCGLSIFARFGGEVYVTACPSCEDTYELLLRAGKLRRTRWPTTVVMTITAV